MKTLSHSRFKATFTDPRPGVAPSPLAFALAVWLSRKLSGSDVTVTQPSSQRFRSLAPISAQGYTLRRGGRVVVVKDAICSSSSLACVTLEVTASFAQRTRHRECCRQSLNWNARWRFGQIL